jgi:hypothetical protein
MSVKTCAATLLSVLWLAVPVHAKAQMSFQAAPLQINRLMLQSVITQGQRSAWADENAQSEGRDDSATDTRGKTFSAAYAPSKSRTRTNLATFVRKTRSTDPQGANQMEQFFASTDIIGQIDSAMRTIGLRADNSAHAYALWWVSAWRASKGDLSTADAGTYAAVAAQALRGLANASAFTGSSDAQKQEMAEAMLVQSALIDASLEKYAGDKAMMAKLASAVRQGAAASGLELDKMTLTPKGFMPAGR